MTATQTRPQEPLSHHETAMAVEVRARFDGTWCTGFELVEIVRAPHAVGFRVRHAGGSLLPELFAAHEVRTASLAAALELASVPVSFVD